MSEENRRRYEAMRNVATEFGYSVREVERTVKCLIEGKEEADEAVARLKALAKRQRALQPRKSYQSPYAKFDKYHKQKRK